ncbi:MAG: amidophosphoribosyltransferase [Phycisphaerae bacterium]|nr:amidophosphoribosyltransferase [Phycisphaerae bacterium]
MSDELQHNCGIAALYWLGGAPAADEGPPSAAVEGGNVTPLLPRMLLDLQNRGQLAAGVSRFRPDSAQLLDTYKDVGTVIEAFRMSHPPKYRAILDSQAGSAAIGHTRYGTCGADDVRYAQPFERHHGRLWKWFSFAFNGQLANYAELRDGLLAKQHYHFTLNTDTEMLMHALAYRLRGDAPPDLRHVMSALSESFDGAYNIVFLDAMGRMFIARDPLGFRPLSWAVQGRLLAAASESVALTNMGFEHVQDVAPGEMLVVEDGRLRRERFAPQQRHAHCFFEWVYFSNVASTIADSGVYLTRARAGQRLAQMETVAADDDAVVVPVPDTAKAAADAFAYALGVPCVEGLIRNRYVGRSFIEPASTRAQTARSKYTPLPSVLNGKKVFLVEDSIVRSTTLATLAERIRRHGGAREIHVRVACPPIVAPCFYGIDMSTLEELFAPKFADAEYSGTADERMCSRMAEALGLDSLRYLAADDLGPCLRTDGRSLCTGCVTGRYPTPCGNALHKRARRNLEAGQGGRTYE